MDSGKSWEGIADGLQLRKGQAPWLKRACVEPGHLGAKGSVEGDGQAVGGRGRVPAHRQLLVARTVGGEEMDRARGARARHVEPPVAGQQSQR